MDNADKRGKVIIDIDGVLNSYSNRRFYADFIYKSVKNLVKVHGRKRLLKKLPDLRKYGGANGLFCWIRDYCGDDKQFAEYARQFVNDLNFDRIAYDPAMKKFMSRLGNYGEIGVRSDGLSVVASAVWQRVIENRPSKEIKEALLSGETLPSRCCVSLGSKNVFISGIDDNAMHSKIYIDSWKDFAEKYGIDLQKSVLIDDSRDNLKIGEKLGMTSVAISKFDSMVEDIKLLKNIKSQSLHDILGEEMDKAVERCRINYGENVDLKTLFRVLLTLEKNSGKDNESDEKLESNPHQNNGGLNKIMGACASKHKRDSYNY